MSGEREKRGNGTKECGRLCVTEESLWTAQSVPKLCQKVPNVDMTAILIYLFLISRQRLQSVRYLFFITSLWSAAGSERSSVRCGGADHVDAEYKYMITSTQFTAVPAYNDVRTGQSTSTIAKERSRALIDIPLSNCKCPHPRCTTLRTTAHVGLDVLRHVRVQAE